MTRGGLAGGGYVVLGPNEGCSPTQAEVGRALEAAGWARWSGDGLPALVVFHQAGPKGDFFEAGFWAGQGVPLFFLGGGARCHRRKQIVNRFRGWTVVGADNRADVPDLLGAIARRGLFPDKETGRQGDKSEDKGTRGQGDKE